jgi:GxxExxY protein
LFDVAVGKVSSLQKMAAFVLGEESYKIIGICMDVHRELGMGFREVVYKDALELELGCHGVPFTRERLFQIEYKGKILKHKYIADFVVYDKIILEVKAASFIVDEFMLQTINYLKVSKLQLGIIVNFGEKSLTHKRLVF